MYPKTFRTTWRRLLFIGAILLCTVMALIPGAMDPFEFINDKVKHALAFFVLALLLDRFAFLTARFTFYKPLGLMAFGVLLEVLQDTVGFRKGSSGDFTDILSNLAGITCYFLVAAILKDRCPPPATRYP